MIKVVCQSVIAALMVADTNTALGLLNESQGLFLDPLEGASLHAEILYCALKQSNKEVIRFLLNIPVTSDLSFYHLCGETPVSLALNQGLDDMLPFILEKTDKNFALCTAVQLKNSRLKDLLLKTTQFKDKLLTYLGLKKHS